MLCWTVVLSAICYTTSSGIRCSFRNAAGHRLDAIKTEEEAFPNWVAVHWVVRMRGYSSRRQGLGAARVDCFHQPKDFFSEVSPCTSRTVRAVLYRQRLE